MTLEPQVIQLIQILVGTLAGAAVPIVIQFIQKKKTPREKVIENIEAGDQHIENIGKTASNLVQTSQEVIVMLKGLLEEERKHNDEEISKARESCKSEIELLKRDYDERLRILMDSNDDLEKQVSSLRGRLLKYEKDIKFGSMRKK